MPILLAVGQGEEEMRFFFRRRSPKPMGVYFNTYATATAFDDRPRVRRRRQKKNWAQIVLVVEPLLQSINVVCRL